MLCGSFTAPPLDLLIVVAGCGRSHFSLKPQSARWSSSETPWSMDHLRPVSSDSGNTDRKSFYLLLVQSRRLCRA